MEKERNRDMQQQYEVKELELMQKIEIVERALMAEREDSLSRAQKQEGNISCK